MLRLVFVSIICIYYITEITAQDQDVIVNTKYGKLRGRRRKKEDAVGRYTGDVDEFLGVPYAKPPIGDFRFRAPVPPCSWEGVRNATSYGNVCPQMYTSSITQEEFNGANDDCLYLNIYAPFESSAPNTTSYPVMMYIHGGSYTIGSGKHYTGYILAHEKVVVVTINYRLNFLGFFTTTNINAPGNYGLLDQTQALKWIQNNIAAFRGDPRKVTIFGSSAGATSVGLHLVSAPSRGLFQRAIMQSGSPFSAWSYSDRTKALANFAAKAFTTLGCSKPNTWNSVQCLKKIVQTKLVNLDHKPKNINPLLYNSIPWIDGAVLPALPETLYTKGNYAKVPVMIGTVMDESTNNILALISGVKNADKKLSDGLDFDTLEGGIRKVLKGFDYPPVVVNATIKQYGIGLRTDTWNNYNNFVKFVSDLLWNAPTIKLANILAPQGTPVYEYLFNHKYTPDPASDIKKWWGVYHQIELNYVFGAPFLDKRLSFVAVNGTVGKQSYTEKDREISRKMMRYWSNFAKDGNPCGSDSSCSKKWTPYKLKTGNYMQINTDSMVMKTNLNKETAEFWNKKVPEMTRKWMKENKEAAAAQGREEIHGSALVGTNVIAGTAVGVFFLFPLLVCNLYYCHQRNKGRNVDYQPKGV